MSLVQTIQSKPKRQQSPSTSLASFFVPDSSPVFRYGDGTTSKWTPGYALQADGYDQTLHLTSSPETISFNMSASSMTLLIPSFKNCTATISLNSSSPIPACAATTTVGDIPFSLYNLPSGVHNVKWDSGPVGANEQIIFWGVEGERPVATSGVKNVTIDDTYSRNTAVELRYDGAWSHYTSGAKGETDVNGDFNSSLAVTTTTGASVSFTGTGSAAYLYGTVGPDHGSASLTLNGDTVASHLNLTSPWAMSYQLLWFATGLDLSKPFEIKMTNLEEKRMTLDFIVLSADTKTLSSLNASTSKSGFLSTTAGKLVVYFMVPLVVLCILGTLVYFYKRRKTSRPISTNSIYLSGYEKRDSIGCNSIHSGQSHHSLEEVFVSYDVGRNQQSSDRWGSPVSRDDHHIPYAPPRTQSTRTLAALPEGQSVTGSPSDEEGTAGTWTRPIRSLMGSSFTSSNATDVRRCTDLPPYSPGANGTLLSSHSVPEEFLSVQAEKAAQLRHAAGLSYSTPNLPTAGSSSTERASTVAPSEILSVFGQPGSERRDSSMTAYSHLVHTRHPSFLRMSMPPRPTVITDSLNHANSPSSALSSAPATSAVPLLQNSPDGQWRRSPGLKRAQSSAGMSAVSSSGSAARPDSDIIPFRKLHGRFEMG